MHTPGDKEFVVVRHIGTTRFGMKWNGPLVAQVLLILLLLWWQPSASSAETVRLKLATTTSTDNSGLLQALLPPFEQSYNIKVDVIAVGTGKALTLGRNGDVDVVLVHAREAEDRFVHGGYGVNRRDVMYNDFVIVGPPNNPAGIRGSQKASQAFKKIAAVQALFISRGDDSGTHKKELSLWKVAEVAPGGAWYMETGQGMGASLQIANEKRGYVLADRGTYIAYRDKVTLEVLCEGDPVLHNPYGIIAVNPVRHPHVRYMESMMLIAWVTSPEGQRIIEGFKRDGKVLFFPWPK